MSSEAEKISIDCPGCGKRFSVAAQHAGKKGKCKSCGQVIEILAPEQPAQEEDDLYDIAEPDTPPPPLRPVMAAPVAQAAASPVLSYSGGAPKRMGIRNREEKNFDPADPFEGNKFKNLYFPLILIGATALFNLLSQTAFKHNATMGVVEASVQMIVKLVVEIPVMLIACVLAVKFLDAAFGPLGPAIIKLSSIALAPDAVQSLMTIVGFLIGRASGKPLDALIDTAVGALIGWVISLIIYFKLFMYYFDLEFGETYRLAIFIWFIRLVLTWLVMMVVISYLMHQ